MRFKLTLLTATLILFMQGVHNYTVKEYILKKLGRMKPNMVGEYGDSRIIIVRQQKNLIRSKLVNYSSCEFIQPGNIMPHYICPLPEVDRFIKLNNNRVSNYSTMDLKAKIETFSTVRNTRVCFTGDSMVNQLFHSFECLLSYFESEINRSVRDVFFSKKYNLDLPGSIEVLLPSANTTISFHGIKGPCKPENFGKIWQRCPPNETDVLIFNIGYLHCSDILQSFSYTKGTNSKINITATVNMTERIVSHVSKIYKDKKILLYGQPAPELVNFPNANIIRKKIAKDKVFRHSSDRIILDLLGIEKRAAKKFNLHYVNSYDATKSFLDEVERIKWGKTYSLGRTDRVHFCLPGPVDFATHEVLDVLIEILVKSLE